MPARWCKRMVVMPSKEAVGKKKCHASCLLELHGFRVDFWIQGRFSCLARFHVPRPLPQRHTSLFRERNKHPKS